MKFSIIFLFLFSINTFGADAVKKEELSIAEKWRPTITKYFGEEFAIKLLGATSDVKKDNLDLLQMPQIPILVVDARSTSVYDKKPDKVILKPEEEAKYHYSFLTELYEVTRQSQPQADDIKKMMNTLSQGATREGVYHSMVLDPVYNQLETIYKPIRLPASEFAVYFYSNYIAKKISPDSLTSMNMYTLKRLIAEKAIDIIDAFGENRDGLETWYAILSSDLATRFPQHWSNKLRKNSSKAVHKNWASKAPIQHIKSEIIIKLHIALNSLM